MECFYNEFYSLDVIYYVIRRLFKGEVSRVVMYFGLGVRIFLII